MNAPNKLSCLRIFLTIIIAIIWLFPFPIPIPVYHLNNTSFSLIQIIVLVLFIIAALTDYIDGQIARKKNIVTTFGKFIDPIADKMLVNTMFILLAITKSVPSLPVIIMIWRDLFVDGIRMATASQNIVIAANHLDKCL